MAEPPGLVWTGSLRVLLLLGFQELHGLSFSLASGDRADDDSRSLAGIAEVRRVGLLLSLLTGDALELRAFRHTDRDLFTLGRLLLVGSGLDGKLTRAVFG